MNRGRARMWQLARKQARQAALDAELSDGVLWGNRQSKAKLRELAENAVKNFKERQFKESQK